MKLSDKIIIIIVFIWIGTFILLNIFSKRSEDILLDYVSIKSTNIISIIINKSINNVLYNNNYNNLIIDYKDSDGNIVNIDFDNLRVNRLLYLITNDILESIDSIQFDDSLINMQDRIYYIPLGIIYDMPILNNLGPKIPFKIDFLSGVNNETNISVKEYGINSSLIELCLNINLDVQVIMPFKSKVITINKNIILDSKIIQGKIPDYYGGLISGSLK